MPLCRYYLSERGCFRGDRCHYEHVNDIKRDQRITTHVTPEAIEEDQEPYIDPLSPSTSSHEKVNTHTRDAKVSVFGLDKPLSKINCRFYELGSCRNGEKCRFSHGYVGSLITSLDVLLPARIAYRSGQVYAKLGFVHWDLDHQHPAILFLKIVPNPL